jgi:hypothetical protein
MIGRLKISSHVAPVESDALEKSHKSHTSAANDGCLGWGVGFLHESIVAGCRTVSHNAVACETFEAFWCFIIS